MAPAIVLVPHNDQPAWKALGTLMIGCEPQARISVAMCTFNGSAYLQEQLETIAHQSRLPFELVVCDDRSTDRTLSILQTFAQNAAFPVRVYENASQLGSTRNFDKAIRLCQGEYIALSDQDDRWKPEKLAHMGRMMDLDPTVGMVFSDATVIDSASRPTGGTLWHSLRFSQRVRAIFETDPSRILLERPVVTGATMIFRRSLFDHFTNIPAIWVHDGWITWMSVFWARPLFAQEALMEYRVHVAQQLGVGETSFFARIAEIRRVQRIRYADMAEEFECLLEYVEQSSPELRERWTDKIQKATTFLKARAHAPVNRQGRFLFLLCHLKSYRRLSASTWRVLLRDFLMGKMETR
jgi:glycosyltransferase involved in cell wall biosynthesis